MVRPATVTDPPPRLWLYGKGGWQGPLIHRGGDEYGRYTLVLRLPGERALVWAYRWCHGDCDEDHCERCPLSASGLLHSGWINGRVVCEDCNPGSTDAMEV